MPKAITACLFYAYGKQLQDQSELVCGNQQITTIYRKSRNTNFGLKMLYRVLILAFHILSCYVKV